MDKTIGYSLDDLRDDGWQLLADFLFEAPSTHPYVKIFKQSENPPVDFLNRMREKGSFAQGLVQNDIGQAAEHADPEHAKILMAVINGSTRYAIVSVDDYSEGFSRNTVPARWADDYSPF